jgi:large subunit ribosomal protein L2
MTSVIIKKSKPTSPGSRHKVVVKVSGLSKNKPFAALVCGKKKISARNNAGRITVRHRGGGHKRKYRMIDFCRRKEGVLAVVKAIEYDPNRSAHIALLSYEDGQWAYIIAQKGLQRGDKVCSGISAAIQVGNALPLRNIPLGTTISMIELKPGGGAKLARAAGAAVMLMAFEGEYALLRLRSGEVRKVHSLCWATIGQVSHSEHNLRQHGKAGVKRWLGWRPTVRGVAMNPIDHPHGGGEGRTSGGRHPVTPWGVGTKGKKTRNNKRTDHMIVRSRHKKKDRS